MDRGAWWAAVHGVSKSWIQLSDFTFTFHFHSLEKEMATHSSVLAWRVSPRDEGAWWAAIYGVTQSRTRLKWLSSSKLALPRRRQWHPTPVLLPGKSHGWRSLVGCSPWGRSLSLFTFMRWRRKWQPTPVFLPGESQGRGSLVGCRLWGRTESDMTEAT